MRQFNITALDDYVVASGISAAVYSKENLNDQLGRFDALAMFIVMDTWDPLQTGASQANMQIQHSGDGRLWVNKTSYCVSTGGTGNPETGVSGVTIDNTKQWATWVVDNANAAPSLRCVRMKFWFTGVITKGHVRIYVTARDRAHGAHHGHGGMQVGGHAHGAVPAHIKLHL